jgi:hypothetical protein
VSALTNTRAAGIVYSGEAAGPGPLLGARGTEALKRRRTVRRLIGMTITVALGLALVLVPRPGRAAGIEDVDKTALMLHGVQAVYASTALAMKGYRAGLLTPEEATAEIARNRGFLAVLSRCGSSLERDAGPADFDQISFSKDILEVCNYLELALGSFETFLQGADELDRKLFDRYVANAENAITRMLKLVSGG